MAPDDDAGAGGAGSDGGAGDGKAAIGADGEGGGADASGGTGAPSADKTPAGKTPADKAAAGKAGDPPAPAPIWGDDLSKLKPEQAKAISRKGWENMASPVEMLDQYLALEKLTGENVVRAPDPEKLTDFFKGNAELLGVPEAADGYEFKTDGLADGQQWNKEFEDAFRGFAHNAGLPKSIASGLVDFYRDYAVKAFADADAEAKKALALEKETLRKEWGKEYDARDAMARRGLEFLGLDEKAVNALEGVMGYSAVMKGMAKVGAGLREDRSDTGGGTSFAGMTRTQAQAEWNRVMDELKAYEAKGGVRGDKQWNELNERQKKLQDIATG